MPAIKKLSFAPLFLISVSLLNYYLVDLFKTTDLLFSVQLQVLIQLMLIVLMTLIVSLLFCLFVVIAANWLFVIPVILVSASLPLIFFSLPLGFFMAAGFSLTYIITFFILDNKLRTYINFQPTDIFGSPIKSLSGWLILAISLAYFLHLHTELKQTPFQIPDSLIETALQFAPLPPELNDTTSTQLNSIPPEQLQFLREHPEELRKSGVDPKILDSLDTAAVTNPKDLIKQTLKDELQKMIQPYTSFIPAGLAGILFITLKSFSALLAIILNPILMLIFYIFEKIGFIKFTTEMRPVKKLIIE